MQEEQKSKVRQQFGVSAHDYATSDIHARGESLNLLVEWSQPQAHWNALDIATGAGHTALAFAPLVQTVMATDITEPMLEQTRRLAMEKQVTNLETSHAEAESLPFDDESFQLVACRFARHHFHDANKALEEMSRVLCPGGTLAFTDNVTVDDEAAANVYNHYEKIRDPSHNHVGSLPKLLADIESTGLSVTDSRVLIQEFEFHKWADRQNVSDDDKNVLQDIMKTIPDDLQPLFAPRWADNTMYFSLWEAVLLARKPER